MKPVIEYFVVRRDSRNRGIIAAYGRWPFSTIKHRGWGDSVARRLMTEVEKAEEAQRTRHHCVTYKTLALLLEDERNCLLPDHAAIYYQLALDLQNNPTVRLFEDDEGR